MLLLLIVFIPTILLGQKTEDESKALNLHNQARIAVGVVPLEWSNNLEKQALNYARHLARKNKYHRVQLGVYLLIQLGAILHLYVNERDRDDGVNR